MDSTEGRGKCTKRLAQIVRKNAKYLSSQEATDRYTAESVFQSAKAKAVKSKYLRLQDFYVNALFLKEGIFPQTVCFPENII